MRKPITKPGVKHIALQRGRPQATGRGVDVRKFGPRRAGRKPK